MDAGQRLPPRPQADLRLRRQLAFVVRGLRQLVRDGGKDQPKPNWQRFLETAGGTALITVLLGGALGSVINWWVQGQLKDRETQQAIMKARADQALVGYKEYLGQEQELIKHAFELIGSSISDSEDLITITGTNFADENIDPATRRDTMNQRKLVRETFNGTDQKWRRERDVLGFLMSYYHQTKGDIVTDWASAEEAVSKYMKCAETKYGEFSLKTPTSEMIQSACKNEKDEIRKTLRKFTSSLESTRRYVWEGYETGEEIK